MEVFVSWWLPLIANHYLNKSFGVALFNLFNTLFRMQMEFNWNYDFSLVIQKWNANKSPIKNKCELLWFAFLSCFGVRSFFTLRRTFLDVSPECNQVFHYGCEVAITVNNLNNFQQSRSCKSCSFTRNFRVSWAEK